MRSTRRVLAAAAAVSLCATAAMADQQASQEQRIAQLQQRIADLEARQATNAREMAATIDQVLRDAEKRSQLLASGGDVSAGYDNGFFIRSGAWELRPGIHYQARYVVNYRSDTGGDKADEVEDGFEIRRMRLDLAGTALTKDLTYYIQWDTNRNNGDFWLLEAWAQYMFSEDWGVRLGQLKDPVTHEFVQSSKQLLAVDYSLADMMLGGGVASYTQGVLLNYGSYKNDKNPIFIEAGITDGAGQMNTNFVGRGEPLDVDPTITGAAGAHSLDWGLAGRIECKAMGKWADYAQWSPKGTKEDLLVFGLGGDWSQGGDGDLVLATADVQYESPQGFGLYGAVLYRYLDDRMSGRAEDTSDWGFLVQGSYMLNPAWEIYARYDVVLLDHDVVFGNGDTEDTFHEVTIGVAYYLGKDGSAWNRAKITVDLTWLPNGAPSAYTGSDILDNNSGNVEWILRAQFQLLL